MLLGNVIAEAQSAYTTPLLVGTNLFICPGHIFLLSSTPLPKKRWSSFTCLSFFREFKVCVVCKKNSYLMRFIQVSPKILLPLSFEAIRAIDHKIVTRYVCIDRSWADCDLGTHTENYFTGSYTQMTASNLLPKLMFGNVSLTKW